MLKKIKMLVCLIFSLLGAFALPHIFKDDLVNFSYSNSIISIIVWIGIYALLNYALDILNNKRLMWISLCCGFLFSAFLVFGSSIYKNDYIMLTALSNWGYILSLTPIFFAIVVIILKKLEDIGQREMISDAKISLSGTRAFLLVWLLIFAAWIPFFLASYPGVFGYDSIYQANYYINGEIDLGHPLVHTYLLGFFVITIGDLLGSYEAGMAVYSIIQMLLLSAIFSAMYTVFIKKRCGTVVKGLILLWYMFFPANSIMGFSCTKDVIFSAVFALVAMLFLMTAEKPERLKSVKFCVLFVGTTFLMLIFRNQGIYVFVLAMMLAFFILKKYRKSVIIISVSCVLVLGIYNGPISTALGGVKSTKTVREMMSVPCVQLSRAMIENADELTENEKKLIEEYIPEYSAYEYNSAISDIMKRSLDTDRIKEKPTEFLGLWVKVGVKCFGTYVNAFARLTIGLWYPDMNYRDPMAYHPYWEYWPTGKQYGLNPMYIKIEQSPVKGFEKLHNWLEEMSYENIYQKTPIVSMFFSSGLTVWLSILYLALCIYKKQYNHLVPCAFIFGLLLTLLLGPVVLFRYVYPLFLCLPLLVSSAFKISSVTGLQKRDK